MARRGRGKQEEGPPAEYVRENLKPGDTVKCAGCDKEHLLKERKHEEGEIDWAFCDVVGVGLARGAPVSAFVCETDSFGPSLRCYTRALKRMARCPGCGLGPRDPDPEQPDEPVTSWRNAGEIPHGSICSRCENAVAAGYASLASRGDVEWRTLCTKQLFNLPDHDEEDTVPGEAFDSLRTAAKLLAKLAAGPNLRSSKNRYHAPLGNAEAGAAPTIPASVGEDERTWASSSDPLAETDPETAQLVADICRAIGLALSLARKSEHRRGRSILKALIRTNTSLDPYAVLMRPDEVDED